MPIGEPREHSEPFMLDREMVNLVNIMNDMG